MNSDISDSGLMIAMALYLTANGHHTLAGIALLLSCLASLD